MIEALIVPPCSHGLTEAELGAENRRFTVEPSDEEPRRVVGIVHAQFITIRIEQMSTDRGRGIEEH
jgi:hypothetical protein